VQELDTKGTAVANVRLEQVETDIERLEARMNNAETEKTADRRVVLGALLAAATAIGMAILGVIIQLVAHKP